MAKELIAGGVDSSALDDDGEGVKEEENSSALQELFWDKVVLFLSSAIVALTAVDILTELLRGGSDIVCYLPEELNVSEGQETFTNSFCAQSLPDTQYLPIFVLIHGVLIALWHYIWKSSFRGQLSLFFSLANELSRLSDATTGDYPSRNLTIIKKLERKFSTYSRREIFSWYQLKLLSQFVTALVSLFLTAFIFTEFDVHFPCPRQGADTMTWPFPGHLVNCIFTSLRLFALVRVFDILLLVFILLILIWGLLWSVWRHPDELGYKNVALFSFTTGMQPSFFVPHPMLRNSIAFCRIFCSRRLLKEFKLRFLTPHIRNDLEFLLLLLYRTESSLAHSFKEGQVIGEYRALVSLDHQIILNKDFSEQDQSKEEEKIQIGWNIPEKTAKNFNPVNRKTTLHVPDNIRGAVLGLSLRAPGNDRAISVSFGSEGFPSVLARVFRLVGSVNFDPEYQGENESSLEIIKYPINITGFRCYDDLFNRDSDAFIEFSECAKVLWKKANSDDYYKIEFMVVGPTTELKHIATAKSLLERWKHRFREKAVLVVLQPLKVETGKGHKQFLPFVPPNRLFQYFDPNMTCTVTSQSLDWPAPSMDPTPPPLGPAPLPTPPLSPQVFHLQCGNTSCDFHISTYEFVWDEDDELDEDSSDSYDSSEDDGSSSSEVQDTGCSNIKGGKGSDCGLLVSAEGKPDDIIIEMTQETEL